MWVSSLLSTDDNSPRADITLLNAGQDSGPRTVDWWFAEEKDASDHTPAWIVLDDL